MNKLDKQVMELLWGNDAISFTIYQIFDALNDIRIRSNDEALKFPTVESALRRLVQRGEVKSLKVARNVTYIASRKKAEAGIEALRKVTSEFFGGDLNTLIPHLSADVGDIDPKVQALLDKIQKLNDEK